jgi:cytochrome P450
MRLLRRSHLVRSREKVLRRLNDENKNTEHRDFIWYILQQQKRHSLQTDEIIVNGALFIVAGSETTANLLSGLFARLIWNPDKYEKLVKELRSSFKNEDEIKSEAIAKLPYFGACIEEGLRIHPPVPAGLLRTVPKGGSYIDGNWVVEGTSVAVTSWAAAHNPANFKNPDSFIPERWLDDEGYATDNKKGMQPFSLGPRG